MCGGGHARLGIAHAPLGCNTAPLEGTRVPSCVYFRLAENTREPSRVYFRHCGLSIGSWVVFGVIVNDLRLI